MRVTPRRADMRASGESGICSYYSYRNSAGGNSRETEKQKKAAPITLGCDAGTGVCMGCAVVRDVCRPRAGGGGERCTAGCANTDTGLDHVHALQMRAEDAFAN